MGSNSMNVRLLPFRPATLLQPCSSILPSLVYCTPALQLSLYVCFNLYGVSLPTLLTAPLPRPHHSSVPTLPSRLRPRLPALVLQPYSSYVTAHAISPK